MRPIPVIHVNHVVRIASLLDASGISADRYLEQARISPRVRENPVGFVHGRSAWNLAGGAGSCVREIAEQRPRNDPVDEERGRAGLRRHLALEHPHIEYQVVPLEVALFQALGARISPGTRTSSPSSCPR
jgi:hypothetical protein